MKTLTLEVSDEVYAALAHRGRYTGISPETAAHLALVRFTSEERDAMAWRDSTRGVGVGPKQRHFNRESIDNIRRRTELYSNEFVEEDNE